MDATPTRKMLADTRDTLCEKDSLAERDGFETSVPGERAYGLNFCLSPYEVRFRRRAPEDIAILRFPVTYRGQMLEVEIGLDKVEYALREGDRLAIRHETEDIQLTRERPKIVRPVSRSEDRRRVGPCLSQLRGK